jgi:CheY-like chemotaxis protein
MGQIGGHIRIDSEVGSGTSVHLYLLRSHESAAADRKSARAPAAAKGRGTVLVVEDEPVVRMLIGDHLREAGYEVTEVDGAAAALPILTDARPLDLLLTDVGLPGMSGRELAREARRLRPDLKIIFATGYAEGVVKRADLVGERMDLVAKPFDLEELSEKIRGLIAS